MFIYKTINLIDLKIYIGQSNKELEKEYFGSGIKIIRAIKKYGKENFKREIIEFCTNKNELNKREIYWIKFYDSTDRKKGYNISIGGNGGNLGEEVNKRISEKLKGNIPWNKGKKGIPAWNKGLNKCDPRVAKYSKTLEGNAKSKEHRQKLSDSKLKEGNRIGRKIFCLNNEKIYNSIKQAADELNIKTPNIIGACKDINKSVKGYKFRYLSEKLEKY